MGINRIVLAGGLPLACSVLFLSGAHAATIDATVFTIRDNETYNTVGTGVGDNFAIGAFNVTPNSNLGTTATAQNIATGTSINIGSSANAGRPSVFGIEYSHADAQAQGLLGPWTITLQNGPDTLELVTPDATNIQQMRTVDDLSVTGEPTAPRVTWALPIDGPPVTQVRYEVWDDDTDMILSGETAIALGANAVSLELSNLDLGTNYAVRIIAINADNAAVTRSSNWLSWTASEANPSGNAAQLTTGSPVSISQTVDIPEDPFTLAFDYKFLTDTGTLSFALDGVSIGPEIQASIGAGFSRAFFDVDIEELLGRTDVPLSFFLDGPTGSTVLLDNIMFPGLVAGDFEDLRSWEAGGLGTVTLATIPLPSSAALMIGALAFLGGSFRVRRRIAAQ